MVAHEAEAAGAGRLRIIVILVGCIAAVIAVSMFFVNAELGLKAFDDGDESEKLVAARMLNHGWHLYKDVFSHHGPVPYMIAHLYSVAVDESDFSYVRVSQVLLGIASCIALILCPAFKTATARIWGASLYLLFLSSIWLLQGVHIVSYNSIAGLLFVIIMAQLVAPALLDEKPNGPGLFCAGVATSLTIFCGYPFGIPAFLFSLSSFLLIFMSPRTAKATAFIPFLMGLALAIIGAGIWLQMFGDIRGFFVYHIYMNQRIYSEFIGFSPLDVLKIFLPSSFSFLTPYFGDGGPIHTVALCSFAGWIGMFVLLLRKSKPATAVPVKRLAIVLLVVLGVVFTNPRAAVHTYDSVFTLANLSLFTIAITQILQTNIVRLSYRGTIYSMIAIITSAALAHLVSNNALIRWWGADADLSKYFVAQKPRENEEYDFIRSITAGDDGGLLALIFNSRVYIEADRMPASGHYYYLPWQAAYNKSAKNGYRIDICADIEARRPAVIWFDNWRVWGKYSIEDYEPCVLSLLTERYAPLNFASAWHLRKDLLRNGMKPISEIVERKWDPSSSFLRAMRLGPKLDPESPIEIVMASNHNARPLSLRRIGVLFGTDGKQHGGQAELRLVGPNNREFVHRFNTEEVRDNSYHYFDVDPGRYTSGKILSFSGGGIRAWEGQIEDDSSTCIIFDYVNGFKGFTPACPIM